MSEDKVYHYLNNGYRETFKHWIQRSTHLKKGCKGTLKENAVETVVKSGTGYVCKICNTTLKHQNTGTGYVCKICNATLKHQNNIKRHKKYAKVLTKN